MKIDTVLQLAAAVGAVIALPMLYVGLKTGMPGLAEAGLGIFASCMLVTPVMRMVPRRR